MMRRLCDRHHFISCLLVLLLGSFCAIQSRAQELLEPSGSNVSSDTIDTYINPVGGITNIGDPFVMKYKGKYYLYPTDRSNKGFSVWVSDNMVDWVDKGLAFDRSHSENKWGTKKFWAPEVVEYKGVFYMTYSAAIADGKLKMRIASATDPTGPFVNYSEPFFEDDKFSYIDGNILIDGDSIYMYYVKDCSRNIINGKHISQIYVAQLSPDFKKLVEEPTLCIEPNQAWESLAKKYQWNEGPFAMKKDGLYYLFYSSNYFASIKYAVGYATSSSPKGPWTKYAGNPVLKKNRELLVSGPGHCCITTSPDDSEYFMVYHTHTNFTKPSGDRNVFIDRMTFNEGVVEVMGPTRSRQELPSGSCSRLKKEGVVR